MSKEGHCLAGAGTSGHVGDLGKGRSPWECDGTYLWAQPVKAVRAVKASEVPANRFRRIRGTVAVLLCLHKDAALSTPAWSWPLQAVRWISERVWGTTSVANTPSGVSDPSSPVLEWVSACLSNWAGSPLLPS